MLHVAVISHGPDTCPVAHPEIAAVARSGWVQLEEAAKKQGITIQGAWVDPTGHVSYVVADAAHAHAVSALLTELKFFHWNTIAIHPVQTVQDVTAQLLSPQS